MQMAVDLRDKMKEVHMPAKRTVRKPRRRTRMEWKPDTPLIPLLRWFLLLAWFLLIAASQDEPQSKAIQVISLLMEMLASGGCRQYAC